jgi:hypothetical protein
MGDLRDFQGQFWLYEIMGLRAIFKTQPPRKIRLHSTVQKYEYLYTFYILELKSLILFYFITNCL